MSTSAHDVRRRVEALTSAQRAALADRLGVGGALRSEIGAAREAGGARSRLVAYVVAKPAANHAPDTADLTTYLRAHLPEYMVPSAIVVLDELPRLPNGKVDTRALQSAAPWPRPEDGFIAPRGAAEQTLARIWADVLGVARVDARDNFFELGGDSILSIQVVARATKAGLVLTPNQPFEHQTLAELAAAAASAQTRAAPDHAPAVGGVALTPIQHWFFEQQLAQPHHWHQVVWLEATAPLDRARLVQAVRDVTRHHDALRLRFVREPSAWRQFHAPADEPVHVECVDLFAESEEEARRAAADLAHAMIARTDLATGLLQVAVISRGDGRPERVLIGSHHLIVDPLSWGILLEDIDSAYSQLCSGNAVSLPPRTTSFQAWSSALGTFAASDLAREELQHWLAVPTDSAPLSVDHDGVLTEATARTVSASLDETDTRSLLHDVHGAYGTQVEDLLLAALAEALGAWIGVERLLVGMERHGREPIADGIDLSRTVGWFTSFFPVVLDRAADSVATLKAVKDRLRAVPGRGIGFGVLRYISDDDGVRDRLRSVPSPRVVFNYSGRVDALPAWAEGQRAASGRALRPLGLPFSARGPHNRREHLLEINTFVVAERLHVHWTYGAEVHERATIERLAHAHMQVLRELIAHCVSPHAGGYTASDFPDAGLSQEELDRLLGGLLQ